MSKDKPIGKQSAAPSKAPAKLGIAGSEQQYLTSLGIEDLTVGSGAECKPSAKVKVHYRGTLMDGTEFDSSYGRGQPIEFPLDNLIEAWQKGIPGMKVGGKRRLMVPYAMGYGLRGSPPAIPPKADLIFDIELLGVR